MNNTYCEICDDIVEFNVNQVEVKEAVDGVSISYKGYECICNVCNSEVIVEKYDDININNYKKALIEENNIISKEKIEDILKKYNIGKKPLAMLLGWGEGTIIRYIDKGHIPSKRYSDILSKLENINEMKTLLINNRERITDIAFNKCINSINNIVVEDENAIDLYQNNKIEKVAKYILSKNYDITPLSLQKILYYTQSFHLALFNELIFEDDCLAWVHGPVYENIYHEYKSYKYNIIDTYEGAIELTEEERVFVDSILNAFAYYTGKALEKFTHYEIPWNKARIGIKDSEGCSEKINKKDIEIYFVSICNKFNILNLGDIKNYSNYLRENIL